MARSILDTLTLAVTVALVVPVVITAVHFLSVGNALVGGALLGLAALVLLLEEYVVTPQDIPLAIAKRIAGRVVEPPDEDGDEN